MTLTDLGEGRGVLVRTPGSDQAGEYEAAVVATDGDLGTPVTVPIVVREADVTLSGVVIDDYGRPVEGVLIKLSQGNRQVREVVTDAAGRYRIPKLAPGEYMVRPDRPMKREFTPTAHRLSAYGFQPRSHLVTVGDRDMLGVDFEAISPD